MLATISVILVIGGLIFFHELGHFLVARLFQGLSVGGEYGATATYMSEIAMRGHRGFYSSFQYVTLIGGQLLAVLVVVILQQFLSEGELKAWGWRIPFVIGAITGKTGPDDFSNSAIEATNCFSSSPPNAPRIVTTLSPSALPPST